MKTKHCCELMTEYLTYKEIPVRYIANVREYGIRVLDGGTSFIVLKFCPWCGQKLPDSLRDARFDELNALGFDMFSDDMPVKFKTDKWWKEKGL